MFNFNKIIIDKQSQINQLKEQKLDQQIDKIETVVDELKDQQIEEKELREEYAKMSKGALNAAYISQGLQTATLLKCILQNSIFQKGNSPKITNNLICLRPIHTPQIISMVFGSQKEEKSLLFTNKTLELIKVLSVSYQN